MRVVGLISGTSFDAIDAAAADLRLEGEDLAMRPLGSRAYAYDEDLRAAIARTLPPAATTVGEICELDTRIGQAFSEAAVGISADLCEGQADLIVSHGQTIFHWVEDGKVLGTLQLGQPAWISERTGSPVVSDLRSRDIAAGGQGAPLVSLFDVLLLGRDRPTAALNLGGIANLTVLPASGEPFAFDVGPANALIDAAVGHLTSGAEGHDEDGRRAARGTVHDGLLRALASDPYYEREPPKSTGKELFNLPYLLERLESFGEIPDDDLLATVTALTAKTVADDLNRYSVEDVVVSGGGVRNPTLLRILRGAAPHVEIRSVDDLGVPSDAKEAYAFAVLGFLTAHGLAGTVPGCTGASRATVLGSITPGRNPLVLPTPTGYAPKRLKIKAPVREAH